MNTTEFKTMNQSKTATLSSSFLLVFIAATLNKMTKTIAAARESDVHVVSADVLDNVKTEGIIAQIKNRAISDWGSDVSTGIG